MLMLAGTGASGVSSRGSEGSGGQQGRSAGGHVSQELENSVVPRQGRVGARTRGRCLGLQRARGGWRADHKHPPLLGMRRQQGRDSGEMECWETRADRLPAGGGDRSPEVPTGITPPQLSLHPPETPSGPAPHQSRAHWDSL